MTIDELGSVGELVGAIATVATLLYLALQIRQSTVATLQTALYQAIESGSHVRLEFVQNPDAAGLYLRGVRDPDSLSPEDALRFNMLIINMFEQIRLIFPAASNGRCVRGRMADVPGVAGLHDLGARRCSDMAGLRPFV